MRRVYANTGHRYQREGSGECGEGARKGFTGEKVTHSLVERQGPPAKRGLQEREAGREGGGKGAGGEEKSARAAGCGERRELSRKTHGLRPALLSASAPFPPPLLPFPSPLFCPPRVVLS